MRSVGIGFRPAWAYWLEAEPSEVRVVEVIAEDFSTSGRGSLAVLGERHPLLLHTHQLSLGTPGDIDKPSLESLADLVRRSRARWISDHLGFCRTGDFEFLRHLPLPLNEDTLARVVARARQVVERCGVPFLLENIETPLRVAGTLTEPGFLNAFCRRSGCGLALDVTALLVNSRNHHFDARDWLQGLDLSNIRQLKVSECSLREGYWQSTQDAGLTDAELWALIEFLAQHSSAQVIILERTANFATVAELRSDLQRLSELTTGECRSHEPRLEH